MKVVGVILARGGSRGIPRKNIKPLGGRPLLDWNVVAARDSGIFDEIWVSTDCDEIAKVAEECGALVHRRSAESASHTASSESGIFDFADAHPDFDVISLIQATSPLTMPSHFSEAFALMTDVNADSLVTAVIQHRFLWKINEDGTAEAKNYNPVKRPLRQDWNGELIENGAFYFTRKATLYETKCRLGGKIACYEMPEHTFTELDSLTDWAIMEGLARQYGYQKIGKITPGMTSAKPVFEIAPGKFVGGDYPPFLIAEGGINHQGQVTIAKALIEMAAKAGANAVKFQKRNVDRILCRAGLDREYNSENAFGKTYGEHKRFLELGEDSWRQMKEHADAQGILFTASGWDEDSIDFLDNLGVPFFKMASADLTNFPLLEHTARKGKPMVMSTGMADLRTVKAAVNLVMGIEPRVILLQCTSTYPAEYKDLHLNVIKAYEQEFPQCVIGYSGHEKGIAVASAVTAMGAKVIERHFTLDRTMKGSDHAASLENAGLEKVIRDIQNVHISLGKAVKEQQDAEIPVYQKLAKSVVSKIAIPKGTTITREMLTTKGPGTGVSPMRLKEMVGKKANADIAEDVIIPEASIDWSVGK